MDQFLSFVYDASVWVIPVVVAITLHEAAHGWVADRLGDDTARRAGRVTFNPLRHVDPFGTVVLPAMLLILRSPFVFGFAKPVPVNFWRLRHPKRDMIWVAAAGPAANMAIAIASGLAVHIVPDFSPEVGGWLFDNLERSILINVVLAVFNMLPIPPLDGGRVMTGLLPRPLAYQFARIERYGIVIVLGLLFIPRFFGLDVFGWVMWPPIEAVRDFVITLTGNR